MIAESMAYRRWAAALMVMAVCLVAVPSVLHMTGRPVELSWFNGQPRDPIMSPMFMGYDAGEGAARQLARIAGPLQGAFSPVSQQQLYAGYHGLNGMEQPQYELVPVGDADLLGAPLGERVASPQQLQFLPRTAKTPQAEALTVSGHAARTRKAMDSVEKLYAQLQDQNARMQAQPFVQEDEEAHELEDSIGKQALLHGLESRLASEAKSSQTKMKDDEDKLKQAHDDLRMYKKHVQEAEHLGNENVKYLTAAQNYAQEAKKEMVDATKRDQQSMQVLASAEGILKQAHTAEVQARVNDNAGELQAAERTISAEIGRVRAAKQTDRIAAEERADAKENAFVSTVISKVRKQRFDKSKLGVRAIAEEGRNAESAQKEEEELLQEDAARHEKAALLLSRARYQDKVKAAATTGEQDAKGGLEALSALEQTEEDARARHRAWGREVAQARLAEGAAREEEATAALLAHQPPQHRR